MDSNKILFISLNTFSYLFLTIFLIKIIVKKHFKNKEDNSLLMLYLYIPLLICFGLIGFVFLDNCSQLFDLINASSKNVLFDILKIGILTLGISLIWQWLIFIFNKTIITFFIPNFKLEDEIYIENKSNLLFFGILLVSICIISITLLNTIVNILKPINQSIIYH